MKCLRPGGFEITEDALKACGFEAGAKVLDVGCGQGATVNYLMQRHALDAYGVDVYADVSDPAGRIQRAAAESLPFGDGEFDGVMYECSFSVLRDSKTAICEAARVLKPQGLLVISDVYARGQSVRLSGILGQVLRRDEIERFLEEHGFRVIMFRDYTDKLKAMMGQMIMDDGAERFYYSMGVSAEQMRLVKCGYFLMIARKGDKGMSVPVSPVKAWLERKTGLHGGELTQESLASWQLGRVRETIAYARENSRFYSTLLNDIRPEEIREPGDMQRIPFTTVDDIRANSNRFACISQNEIEKITTITSSGTTGSPKRIFFSAEDLEIIVQFFAVGMSSMVEAGERVLILMPCIATWSIGDILAKGLERIGVSCVRYGPVTDYADAIYTAKRERVTNMVGIPAQVYRMARLDKTLRPRTVLLSADYVPQSVVDTIEQSWRCEVFNHYGMTETGLAGGVECHAHDGYHMRDADMLFEVVDPATGRQALPGEYGEVVMTTLNRIAMPLIRFKTGDISRILTGMCGCGMGINRLDKVMGRWINSIELTPGRFMSIHEMDEVLLRFEDVLDYRARLVSEKEDKTLEVFVKSAEGFDSEALKAELTGRFGIQAIVQSGEGFFTKGTLKRNIEIINK